MMNYFPEHAAAFAAAARKLEGRRVAVIGHLRPDGDCIGSQVGLVRVLHQNFGADAFCLNGHDVPRSCASFVADTPFFTEDGIAGDAIAVTVDCADNKRFGEVLGAAYPQIYLNIDHHISNTCYAETNLVEPGSSATGELLAGIFLDNGYKLDPITAQALYVGIATDTGQFRFSSTTYKTFEICCRLMENGANPAAAALELYERESPAKIALLQRFLASFEFFCDRRVCLGVIRQEDWDMTGSGNEDTEGMVDYARSIDGVAIGILVEEHDGVVKGSFRAKDPIHRVDQIAARFNGGGHACAAGFTPGMSLQELLPRLKEVLEQHFKTLIEKE